MRKTTFPLIALLLIAFGLGPGTAQARKRKPPTLVVTKVTDDVPNGCTSSDCSLREALIRANATSAVERIVLGPQTYEVITGADNEDASASGDLDVLRPVVVSGQPGSTSIDVRAPALDRAFRVLPGGRLRLSGVTVSGGMADYTAESVDAGGGGLYVAAGGSASLVRSSIERNVADTPGGGGIMAEGPVTLTDSTVSLNEALGSGTGGGILSRSTDLSLVRSMVGQNDSAGVGGGIAYLAPGALRIDASTIDGNEAAGDGGGISTFGSTTTTTTFAMTRSAVSNNGTNGHGGGLDIEQQPGQPDARVLIEDSTISSNAALLNAGGLHYTCSTSVCGLIQHSTITRNTADADNNSVNHGGGGYAQTATNLQFRATILAGNIEPSGQGSDCYAGFDSLGANVVGNSCIFSGPTDVVSDGTFLGPLADNGGPTKTHAIDPTDPAADILSGEGCGGTDQRGVPRPSGTGCDAGSYEYQACGDLTVNIVGTNAGELIVGTSGSDAIMALGGNDRILAGDGNDSVCAGSGKDRIYGEGGDDSLFAEAGKDRIDGGTATETDGDRCVGGSGIDRFANCEQRVR
jgi:CSLREA domain-containing protein